MNQTSQDAQQRFFAAAQIDDLLLPAQAYLDLIERHDFVAIGGFDLGHSHAVTHGRAPS